MTYVIAEPCIDIKDRSCIDVCPVDCIHVGRAHARDRPRGVHRLRRLRARVPGRGDLPRGRAAREVGAVRARSTTRSTRAWTTSTRSSTSTPPSTTSRTSHWSSPNRPEASGRIRFWIPMAEDLHELSALYALDALTGEDRARFEAHLAECGRCGASWRVCRGPPASLAFAVEGPAPPPATARAHPRRQAHAEGQNVVPLRGAGPPSRRWARLGAGCDRRRGWRSGSLGLPRCTDSTRRPADGVADPRRSAGATHSVDRDTRCAPAVAPSGDAALTADLPALPNGKVD